MHKDRSILHARVFSFRLPTLNVNIGQHVSRIVKSSSHINRSKRPACAFSTTHAGVRSRRAVIVAETAEKATPTTTTAPAPVPEQIEVKEIIEIEEKKEFDYEGFLTNLPRQLEVVIEISKWGFTKKKADGSVDFFSPIPTPFNYGSVPSLGTAGDGDPQDALVLGPKLPSGHTASYPAYGLVKFTDGGSIDNKIVLNQVPSVPSGFDKFSVNMFFTVYGVCKKILNTVQGKQGETHYAGVIW
eukprot:CAMPEP_0184657108 /NCGR_PEP_ID=MMETSP0308-20130426/16981_1 /TAXON_ID=38269 /ORGANISM="Gloeochaete witrockiana, Strain SAG 46.84" /LENGTH=242 /DNA_ID=CAMNT_0027094517 /DNA_START=42 /DNA_END=767 /DNA_ORIENTATION=+